MIGTIWWNLIGGAFSFVCTFLLSIGDNLLLTSLLKGTYSFAIIFVLMFVVRFVLGIVLEPSPAPNQPPHDGNETAESSGLGRHLDLTTPDDHPDDQAFKPMTFAPFDIPGEDRKKPGEMDTDALVKAVRHLTGDEGR